MPAFRVVVPVRQAERWIGRCLRSIRRQTAPNLRCAVIDDGSEDRTLDRARDAVRGDDRFLVSRSPHRRYGLANIREGIRSIAHDPQDVVVLVDGDDWLRHPRALDVLARIYDAGPVWTTYGSHQRWKGCLRDRLGVRCKRGNARPYPPEVVDGGRVRAHPWYANHPRTFRRFLWDAIRDEDLRDADGGRYRVGWDLAIAFPMLEMAGSVHSAYVHELLYVYNVANPLSDARLARAEQLRVEARIRARPPYARLAEPLAPSRREVAPSRREVAPLVETDRGLDRA